MQIKPLKQYSREKEAEYIGEILNYFKGNISKTARALGVDRKTLYNKAKLCNPKKAVKVL